MLLFGVLGTIITFTIFSALMFAMFKYGEYSMYDVKTGKWDDFELTLIECMVISSILCSSDVIVAISVVKYDD